VLVDSLPMQVSSSAGTVESLLAELGMTVREGDLVRPALDTSVTAGMTVRLAKGRTITVKLDGKEQSLYTLAPTVADVFRLLSIDPATIDSVSLPSDAATYTGMSLTIARTIVVEEQSQDPIAPGALYEDDPNTPYGQDRVIEGVPGIRTHHYSVTYKNGDPVSRVEIGTPEVTQVPTPTRHVVGAKAVATAARPTLDAPDYKGPYRAKVMMFTTWYSAIHGGRAPGDPNYGRTASGVMLDKGICAVDRSVYPFGTRFFVPGYGMCVAADTGGAVTGNHLDLGFPDSAGDPGWGSKTIEVYVLD
jgi:3D (Asp-Asp-Asp) domain-containing protein